MKLTKNVLAMFSPPNISSQMLLGQTALMGNVVVSLPLPQQFPLWQRSFTSRWRVTTSLKRLKIWRALLKGLLEGFLVQHTTKDMGMLAVMEERVFQCSLGQCRDLVVNEEMALPLVSQGDNRVGEPIHLKCLLPDQSCASSNWVLKKIKEIHHFVRMDCEGYEEQFMILFTAIEVGHIVYEIRSQKIQGA